LILLDTSGLFAALNATQPEHETARRALEQAPRPLLLSPFVLAELDYLVTTRVGGEAELALLEEIATGVYELCSFNSRDVREALEVLRRYSDFDVGLADASVVVLAGRFGATTVLTLDEHHFRVLRPPSGDTFELLPADLRLDQ
jgi:uncharacterized protein